MKTGLAVLTRICLGFSILLLFGCVRTDSQQDGKIVFTERKKEQMAVIPLPHGVDEPVGNIAKVPETQANMAVIPNDKNEPSVKILRHKKRLEPEKMMAIIPGSSEE